MPTAATVSIYTQHPVSTTYKALAPDRTYDLSKPQVAYLLKNGDTGNNNHPITCPHKCALKGIKCSGILS